MVGMVDPTPQKIQKLKTCKKMKRRTRFLVALLSAAFTFGVLFVTVGTDHWKRSYYHHGYHHHDDHHHRLDDGENGKKQKLEASDSDESI